ncbi:MAG: bifunctional (p)ppGpp synthetase/guanosine-3',5'-bis(diphosphate) 3'-pyrophosphohydrolase [Rhodospirillales bacterium]|nr:bifunctional (p)ppGpp synthetase/guanosine-3',5'-bis(diphosphate) 3'-pyrophosphohydrolase [Rhodospirillales bacterium]
MIRQFELLERVLEYDPDADEDALNRAYVYAMKMHGSQKRASGDPYFSHPNEVAGILTEYRLDTASIITALLHDTVEDTDATAEDLQKHFGDEVLQLVDGVTKLTRIELLSDQSQQAENFRKLLLAMSKDIRVLLVKLADRLHNMRTLNYIENPNKRHRIAQETMEIYAPLAERIGMHAIKNELEELAFAELNPDARNSVLTRLDFLRKESGESISGIIGQLTDLMKGSGFRVRIFGREKQPHSIWRKMQRESITFEQLSDIMAFRLIVPGIDDVYRALGAIHAAYPVVPGRFKDYISTPKPNGYQSLHTGVFGPRGERIEVQIRTEEMQDVAERGVAAHWSYKQGVGSTEGPQYRWLRELLEILDQASGPEEFLENTKLEMFQDQVFCFTPKGYLISLPFGATPVDFAYAVHSEVGDTCVGAKINGRIRPLKVELRNGDQVEILTSKAQTPSPEWERFVVTGRARARIRRFMRAREREQYGELGRSILIKAFREAGYEYSDKALDGVLKRLKSNSAHDVFAAVGSGHFTAREVVETVYPGVKAKRLGPEKVVPIGRARTRSGKEKTPSVPIVGLISGMAVHFAGCCHPLPGDRIVGIITTGKGVTIHTIDCHELEGLSDQPERWLDVSWEMEGQDADIHVGRLNLVLSNEAGSLGAISNIIAKNDGNISNLNITNRSADFFEILLDIEVKDLKHLTNIIAALRASNVINEVERARG